MTTGFSLYIWRTFSSSPFYFLAAFLICAFLPVFNLISLGRLALVFLLFCSSAPTLTPFFTPYSSLFLESPFIPLLNICIHFSIEYKKIQCLILQLLTTRMTFTFSSLSDLPLVFFLFLLRQVSTPKFHNTLIYLFIYVIFLMFYPGVLLFYTSSSSNHKMWFISPLSTIIPYIHKQPYMHTLPNLPDLIAFLFPTVSSHWDRVCPLKSNIELPSMIDCLVISQ